MKPRLVLTTFLSGLALSACAVGPDYEKPQAPQAQAFKEQPPKGWKTAQPSMPSSGLDWWKMFNDPVLDRLMARIGQDNQSVAAAKASYRQARAAAQEARAGFFPTLGLNGQTSRGLSSSRVTSSHRLTLDASWEPDLWGSVARDVENADASAQGQAANLAAIRLTAQAELAQDYLQLRITQKQRELAKAMVDAYAESLRLTRNQLAVGLVTPVDVAQAQSLLSSAEVQVIDYDLSARQLEHAIAILLGTVPADFTLPAPETEAALPVIPVGLPSELLERRPDVAQAERAMAAANATIGVQTAAYFPTIGLSGTRGYSAATMAELFTNPARVWSLGASLAQTLFDGGARDARVDQARASYDASVAQYRQTVLTAFQEVEDNLAALALLEDEASRQEQAVLAAREAERLAINQYKSGTVDFTTVASAQISRWQAEISSLQLLGRRFSASALLIKATGGGWDHQMSPVLPPS